MGERQATRLQQASMRLVRGTEGAADREGSEEGVGMSVRDNETPRGSLGWHQGGRLMDGRKRVPADDGSRCSPGVDTPANPTRPEIRQRSYSDVQQ